MDSDAHGARVRERPATAEEARLHLWASALWDAEQYLVLAMSLRRVYPWPPKASGVDWGVHLPVGQVLEGISRALDQVRRNSEVPLGLVAADHLARACVDLAIVRFCTIWNQGRAGSSDMHAVAENKQMKTRRNQLDGLVRSDVDACLGSGQYDQCVDFAQLVRNGVIAHSDGTTIAPQVTITDSEFNITQRVRALPFGDTVSNLIPFQAVVAAWRKRVDDLLQTLRLANSAP